MIVADEYIPAHLQQNNAADDTFIEPHSSRQNKIMIQLESYQYTDFQNLFDTVVHKIQTFHPSLNLPI